MKTVTVKIMGKPAQVLEDFTGNNVGEIVSRLGLEGSFTANIGGTPASMETTVANGAYVVLSPAVKGA